MKTPRFFIDADDGMGSRLFGEADNLELAKRNLFAELQVALDGLIDRRDGSQVIIVLERIDMTEQEVIALPEE